MVTVEPPVIMSHALFIFVLLGAAMMIPTVIALIVAVIATVFFRNQRRDRRRRETDSSWPFWIWNNDVNSSNNPEPGTATPEHCGDGHHHSHSAADAGQHHSYSGFDSGGHHGGGGDCGGCSGGHH